jgi:hypothetical protein
MEKLLDEKTAAELLGMSVEFLQGNRYRRGGDFIPFIRVGRRAVRYRMADLEKAMENRLQTAPAGK